MKLEYLTTEHIPRIQPDQELFNRYGKASDYSLDFFKYVVEKSKLIFENKKYFKDYNDEGIIHVPGQYKIHTLFQENLRFGDLLVCQNLDKDNFLKGFVKHVTNNNPHSRAGASIYAVLEEIFAYNRERLGDKLKEYAEKRHAQKTLRKISAHKYQPTGNEREVEENEGIRLLSLYRVIAAANNGDKLLTQKLFQKHTERFPGDDKNLLTDNLRQLQNYKQKKITAEQLIEDSTFVSLEELMLYVFLAFINEEIKIIEAFFLNPHESIFIHKLILLLFPFIQNKESEFFLEYKFLIASLAISFQHFPDENSEYNDEIKRVVPEMVKKFNIELDQSSL